MLKPNDLTPSQRARAIAEIRRVKALRLRFPVLREFVTTGMAPELAVVAGPFCTLAHDIASDQRSTIDGGRIMALADSLPQQGPGFAEAVRKLRSAEMMHERHRPIQAVLRRLLEARDCATSRSDS